MNANSSKQRKLIYTGLIIALLIPIGLLGRPGGASEDSTGGQLAQMRTKYKLGESTLGEVDPSSATMNLLLLGLRGIAVDYLWMQADEQRDTKDWANLRSTVNSIILLQPHFKQVWDFQGWNLAYNVSAEWDGVSDRYYWLKEGAKFLRTGARRNDTSPELYFKTGTLLGQKLGRADEKKQYRSFFRSDPDVVQFKGGPDPDLNPEGKDNYLVAREYYEIANDRERTVDTKILADVLFRSYPMRSIFDYATALQADGSFTEKSQEAWDLAFDEWTTNYGQEVFDSPGGNIRLEVTSPDDLTDLLTLKEEDARQQELVAKQYWVGRYQDMTNYRYWRTRAKSEAESNTVQAHRLIYQGQELFVEGQTAPQYYQLTAEGEKQLKSLTSDDGADLTQKLLQFIAKAEEPVTERDLDEADLFTDEAQDLLDKYENGEQWIVRVSKAQLALQQGLVRYAAMLEDFPQLEEEDLTKEEALLALYFWRANFKENDIPIPQSFPLKRLWDRAEKEDSLGEIERLYLRKTRGQ